MRRDIQDKSEGEKRHRFYITMMIARVVRQRKNMRRNHTHGFLQTLLFTSIIARNKTFYFTRHSIKKKKKNSAHPSYCQYQRQNHDSQKPA